MMSNETRHLGVKKRLMFVKGEDFYFLSYNILLILKHLKCDGNPRRFKDYRKLAFLIDFVADKDLINILQQSVSRINRNSYDRQQMSKAYSEGLLRVKLIARLLYALEQQGLIGMEKDLARNTISVWVEKENLQKDFFDKQLFKNEIDNLNSLTKVIRGISNAKHETLIQKLFQSYDINKWDI